MSIKPGLPKFKILLPFVLSGIVLVSLLTLLLRDIVRESILKPLAYTWNLILLLINGTPQALFWGIFILISIFIILKALLEGKPPAKPALPFHEEAIMASQDRVYHWIIHVQSALHGNIYFLDRVTRSLERVVMGVIAYQERLTVKEVGDALSHREIELPISVNALFDGTRGDEPAPERDNQNHIERIGSWFRNIAAWLNRRLLKKEPLDRFQRLEEIIDYLETQLEINHGS